MDPSGSSDDSESSECEDDLCEELVSDDGDMETILVRGSGSVSTLAIIGTALFIVLLH